MEGRRDETQEEEGTGSQHRNNLGFSIRCSNKAVKRKTHTFAHPYRCIDAQRGAKREVQSVWEGNKRKGGRERERDIRRSRWRNESVDYGLWLSLCVCVGLSVRFSHTVKTAHSQCAYACDCVCISHKVCSNWETAALTLTVGLHAKITRILHTHTHTHTPTHENTVCFSAVSSLSPTGWDIN